MRFLDEGGSEKQAKLSAIRSLIDHIDDALNKERGRMKEMKMGSSSMADEEESVVFDDETEPSGIEEETMIGDGDADDEIRSASDGDLGNEIHQVTKYEDNPEMGSEVEENAEKFADEMQDDVENNYKYKPRVSGGTEKGNMVIVNRKATSEAPVSPFEKFKSKKKR